MIGKAECSVDDKRRFSLPPKYRAAFGVTPNEATGHYYPTVILPWFKGALAIFPIPIWEEIAAGIRLLDYTIEEFDTAKLICLSRAEPVNTDPEGRLTLTADHMNWIRIQPGTKGRLVVAGVGPYLQAFNADEWDTVQKTGNNGAARSGQDLVYDKALKELLDQARRAAKKRRDAGALPESPPASGPGIGEDDAS
jgi:DNA-binding transcriptional regulator/RsmH inhibitor MraZ